MRRRTESGARFVELRAEPGVRVAGGGGTAGLDPAVPMTAIPGFTVLGTDAWTPTLPDELLSPKCEPYTVLPSFNGVALLIRRLSIHS